VLFFRAQALISWARGSPKQWALSGHPARSPDRGDIW